MTTDGLRHLEQELLHLANLEALKLKTDGTGMVYKELPELNEKLLIDCVDFAIASHKGKLEEDSPSWNQGNWCTLDASNECSTSFCIAGYALYAEGFTKIRRKGEADCGVWNCAVPGCDHHKAIASYVMMINLDKVFGPDYTGPTESVQDNDWANGGRVLLGLTCTEESALFDGSNEIADVVYKANAILTSRGLPAHEFAIEMSH